MLKITYIDGINVMASYSDESSGVSSIPLSTICIPFNYSGQTLYEFKDSDKIKYIDYLNDKNEIIATVNRKNILSFAKFFTARAAVVSMKGTKMSIQYTRLGVVDTHANINEVRVYPNGDVQRFTTNVAKVVATNRID